jgi:hypothetical protein
MNVEWEVPMLLTSPRGTLKFNQADDATGGFFMLDPTKCLAKAPIRATVDQIPQASGSILHREYREGYVMTLAGAMMEAVDNAACGVLLREMWDVLGLHLNALECEVASDENDVVHRRIQWTPTSYGQDRILADVRLNEDPTQGLDTWTTFIFSLHSPYPYAIDATETTTSIGDGATVTITNPGNCPIFPAFKVNGAATAFTYSNLTYGFDVIYDDTLPGAIAIPGGDYAFFNHFENNVFLNGDMDNLIAGVDLDNSDFFPLMPGANAIKITGAGMDVIWNAGWRT